MHRSIDPNQTERCTRCGGKPTHIQRQGRTGHGVSTAKAARACNCWDPLVEWLMDRTEKRQGA